MWKLLGILVLSSVLFLRTRGNSEQVCWNYSDCSDCLANIGCGWCPQLDPTKSICLEGTDIGPSNRTYTCNWWRYGSSLECINEDECLPFSECDLCTQQLHCGWCGSVCLTGTSKGPQDTDAGCVNWTWESGLCDATPPCSQYSTCNSCVNQKSSQNQLLGCIWNNQQKVCTLNKIDPLEQPYPASDWSYHPSQCSEKLATCDSYNRSCKECVFNGYPECGWCEGDPPKCIDVSNSAIQCADFRYGTCRKTCYSQFNCNSCNQNPACGWCTNFCSLGNSTRPQYLPKQYCEPWSYNQNCNLKCENLIDCDNCLSNGCHWCSGVCQENFINGCCSDCYFCIMHLVPGNPSIFMHITVAMLVCFGSILIGLAIIASLFVFWKKYWLKRHHFKEFQ